MNVILDSKSPTSTAHHVVNNTKRGSTPKGQVIMNDDRDAITDQISCTKAFQGLLPSVIVALCEINGRMWMGKVGGLL
jgi:hypothetical protein